MSAWDAMARCSSAPPYGVEASVRECGNQLVSLVSISLCRLAEVIGGLVSAGALLLELAQ